MIEFICFAPALIGNLMNVGRCLLGVFDKDVEIAVFVENAGVEQFIFGVVAAAPPIGFDQITLRISILRVFIKIFHV